MFSCLWQLWDWYYRHFWLFIFVIVWLFRLDPTSMENKKGAYQQTPVTPGNEIAQNEAPPPKQTHQHNSAPQHLRLLQFGLKIPNHPHQQFSQNQPLNSPLHLHMHQQVQYQTHRHLQASPQFNNTILPNAQQYLHYHQKPLQNQPIYQTSQPPPLHPHSQVGPSCPQIWVPHQPPVHYHQQQQYQQQKIEKSQSQQPVQQPQQKPKEIIEKKKSNSSQLRSPSAKRPLEAPVTMQGWLHKQGSEGLMLWKKRWFVLSEYCLFYYKGDLILVQF